MRRKGPPVRPRDCADRMRSILPRSKIRHIAEWSTAASHTWSSKAHAGTGADRQRTHRSSRITALCRQPLFFERPSITIFIGLVNEAIERAVAWILVLVDAHKYRVALDPHRRRCRAPLR